MLRIKALRRLHCFWIAVVCGEEWELRQAAKFLPPSCRPPLLLSWRSWPVHALIDIEKSGRRSLQFAKDFLAAQNTAVVPGITFGLNCDSYVRVAFTIADERLREGLERLRSYIEGGAPY
jgi:aspartate/methionine/tyrosine aminotransferase